MNCQCEQDKDGRVVAPCCAHAEYERARQIAWAARVQAVVEDCERRALQMLRDGQLDTAAGVAQTTKAIAFEIARML